MLVWIHLSPTLATPSLRFHPLTFSLSLVKLLIDAPPARLLLSCQKPSNIKEYCANIQTSHVLTLSPRFGAELDGTGPPSSPHLPVLSQDIRRGCVITAGSSQVMFFLKRKNISSALLPAEKYFEAGKCVLFFSTLSASHCLAAHL